MWPVEVEVQSSSAFPRSSLYDHAVTVRGLPYPIQLTLHEVRSWSPEYEV